MITKLSHATIYVLDQDEALKFYRDKLGFEVRTDARMRNGVECFRDVDLARFGRREGSKADPAISPISEFRALI